MLSIRFAVAAVVGCAAAFAAASASAQSQYTVSTTPYGYATFGYADHNVGTADLGTVQGRIGIRINRWFGFEGEVGGGVNREGVGLQSVVGSNSVSKVGRKETVRIGDQEAVYVVGYLPIMPDVSLFGRVGAGRTDWKFTGPAPWGTSDGSYNLGGGAMAFWGRNGARAEYVRETFGHGPAGDTWAISYVRRF